MPKDPMEWTEQDLEDLVGQPESFRLEFKSSRLFKESQNRITDSLSREVSAFANSEGGHIVIGIEEEKKGRMRVAKGIDEGVDLKTVSPEWLQQIIESNVRPYLTGIRIRSVRLTGMKEGSYALIVRIPQGNTAYQASDFRYYSRSEYEAVGMPDHEVRLRMMRGRIPQAKLEIYSPAIITAEQEYAMRTVELSETLRRGDIIPPAQKRRLEAPKRDYNEVCFGLMVRNIGAVTIRDLLLQVSLEATTLECNGPAGKGQGPFEFRFTGSKTIKTERIIEIVDPERKMFPEQVLVFPSGKWSVKVPIDRSIGGSLPVLKWTIYLDDSPPSIGIINVVEHLA